MIRSWPDSALTTLLRDLQRPTDDVITVANLILTPEEEAFEQRGVPPPLGRLRPEGPRNLRQRSAATAADSPDKVKPEKKN